MMTGSNKSSIESCSNNKTLFLDDATTSSNIVDCCTPSSSSDGLTLEDLFRIRSFNFSKNNIKNNNIKFEADCCMKMESINSAPNSSREPSSSLSSRSPSGGKNKSDQLASLVYTQITFDCDDTSSQTEPPPRPPAEANEANGFYFSMPNLNACRGEIEFTSKNLSFYDLTAQPRCVFIRKKSIDGISQKPTNCSSTNQLPSSGSTSTFNFSRLTNLAKLMSYWNRLGDSVKQLIQNTFNAASSPPPTAAAAAENTATKNSTPEVNKSNSTFYRLFFFLPRAQSRHSSSQLSPISEEILMDSYDIIELDEVMWQAKVSPLQAVTSAADVVEEAAAAPEAVVSSTRIQLNLRDQKTDKKIDVSFIFYWFFCPRSLHEDMKARKIVLYDFFFFFFSGLAHHFCCHNTQTTQSGVIGIELQKKIYKFWFFFSIKYVFSFIFL